MSCYHEGCLEYQEPLNHGFTISLKLCYVLMHVIKVPKWLSRAHVGDVSMLWRFAFDVNSFCRLLRRSGLWTSTFIRWHCRRVQFERLVHCKSGHRGLYFSQDFRRWKTYILCLKNSYSELQFNRVLHILCPRKTGWYLCVYIGLFPSEEIKLLLILCGCQLICHQRMSIVISQLVSFNYYSIYWGHRGSFFRNAIRFTGNSNADGSSSIPEKQIAFLKKKWASLVSAVLWQDPVILSVLFKVGDFNRIAILLLI